MAGDNPATFYNVPDSYLKTGEPIRDVTLAALVYSMRHLYEIALHDAAGETQQVYGHSHGEVNGTTYAGITKRRSIFTKSFECGAFSYAEWTFLTASWNEVLRWRACVGPFQNLATEVRYAVTANNVKFRIERYDWVDSAAASTQTQGLQEQTADKGATSATWHTIDGQAYNGAAYAGSDTKLMPLDGPTSFADLDEICNLAEFRLHVYPDTGSTTFRLYDVDMFEVLSDEETSATGWLD